MTGAKGEGEDQYMYKIQESCDNCYHCETIGCLVMCHNEISEKYEKEVEAFGVCEHFKKGIYWEELENEKNKK